MHSARVQKITVLEHFLYSILAILTYEGFPDLVDMKTSQSSCRIKGGELALPTSHEETAAILATITALDSSIDWAATDHETLKLFWLNIEEDEHGKPTSPLEYTNYVEGQPNRANETCVAARATTAWIYPGHTGEWSDRPCNATYPYVCQFSHTG